MPSKIVFWKQMKGLLSTIASAAGLMPTANLGTGTANATTFLRGDQSYQPAIVGSTGSNDNRILRSDGTGGLTVQSSVPTLDDTGNLTGVIGLVAGSGSFAATSTFDAVMWNGGKLGFASTGSVTIASVPDVYFVRNSATSMGLKSTGGVDAAFTAGAITSSGNLAVRNGTTNMIAEVFRTYTSSTSFESLTLKTTASAMQIGSAIGSGGGSNRDILLGHLDATGTMTAALTGITIYAAGLVESKRLYLLESFQGHFALGRHSVAGVSSAPIVVGGDLGLAAVNGAIAAVDTRLRRTAAGAAALISGDANSTTPASLTVSNIVSGVAGFGLQIKTGTGARAGNATLVGGTVTVTNTTVTANTIVYLTAKTAGGTIGTLTYTLSAGASFTINSASILDTSVISYLLIELNP